MKWMKILVGKLLFLCSFCLAQNIITTVDTAYYAGEYPSIAISTDELPVISYRDGDDRDLKVLKCGNASCTIDNIITTVDQENVGSSISITIPDDGMPIITYFDELNKEMKVIKCGNGSCTSGNTITTVDITGSFHGSASMAVPSDGLPVIAYWHSENLDLNVLKCGNSSCSSGNTITTVDSGNVGPEASIAISSNGLPIISYYYLNNDFNDLITYGDLKVIKCGNATCSSGNTITTVDSSTDVGECNSITVPGDDLPIISYYDSEFRDLKVVKCGDISCSSGNTITTVDAYRIDGIGCDNSIGILNDGLPMISYYHLTNRELRTIKCGNAYCSDNNIITTLDSIGDMGLYNSIAIPNDGLPIISYLDYDNFQLKVVKCGKADCTDGTGGLQRQFISKQLISISQLEGILTIMINNTGLVSIVDINGNTVFEYFVSKPSRIVVPRLIQGIYFVRANFAPFRRIYSSEKSIVRKVSVLY